MPLFHDDMETLLDYLPGASVSLDHQADEVLDARLEMIADHYAARRAPPRDGEVPYRPLPPERLYLDRAGWDAMLGAGAAVRLLSPFAKPDGAPGIDGGGRPGPMFAQSAGAADRRANVFDQLRGTGGPLGRRGPAGGGRRLDPRLARAPGASAARAWLRARRRRRGRWAAVRRLPAGPVSLVTLGLERGFVAERLAVVGEQDLLGERISRPPRRRKRADQFIAEATEIAEGDLVVHQDYGIGRYDGLVTLTVSGAPHDCLRLIYDGDDKLFLPVENIEMLVALRQRERRRRARQARRRRLADAQGAGRSSRIRDMAERADPHRRRAQGARGREHGPARGQLGRVLRPLPLRRDRGPGARHRRRAGGSGLRPADGPADLRRCRLRQDRGGAARGVRRRDVGHAGRRRGADDAAGAPAFPRRSPRASPACR